MNYLATATNAVIDTTNIKNILIQGELGHPAIRFTLDPALTGLAWRVRGSWIGTPYFAQSVEITPTETVDAVTVDWIVSADFTTYHGAMQLTLVGSDGSTEIVKFLGTVAVQQDLSVENLTPVTQNFFDQLMAQAADAISKYPIIDDGDGNWYTYNVTTELYEDTGVHAQGVQGVKGDKGDTGAAGQGVITGGTENQVPAKNSATDYDMKWLDVLSIERTATLAAGSWSGSSAPYSQAITVTGVTVAGKPPIIDVVLSDTYATALNELTAYGLVYRFKVTADNTVTAYATAIPATAINIHAKLVA